MVMPPRLRRFALTAHVMSTVGWLGAVVVFLALAVIGLSSQDAQTVRGTYLVMDPAARLVLVPLAFASLLTGLMQSLGTVWGLFRHYWVLVKFVLALVGTAILLMHMPSVSRMAVVATSKSSFANLSSERLELAVHAGGGLLMLLTATVLSIYKPWGRTAYGLRKQKQRPKRPSRRPPQRLHK